MRRTFLTWVVLTLLISGCASAHHRGNLDTTELDRCIVLIQSRAIRRGMTASELQALFPDTDSLFMGEERASALHTAEPGAQWGPQWEIDFALKDGLVTDYSISMRGDK